MKTAHFLRPDLSATQDLSAGPLTYTTVFARKFKLEQITFHFSQAVTETITITLISALGTNYNVVLQSAALVSETDFVFRPQGQCNFQSGDALKIQCTNVNLVGIAFAAIKNSEM